MGLLRSPAWRRAPLLVWRQPGLVSAALVAGLVLGVAVAAQPMYASASGTAALAEQVGAQCRWLSGVTVDEPLPTPALADLSPARQTLFLGGATLPKGGTTAILGREEAELTSLQQQSAALDAPVTTLTVNSLLAGQPKGNLTDHATLISRTGALAHVRLLTPEGRPGVWVSNLLAATSRLVPGGTLALSEGGPRFSLPVAGIYEDIKSQPVSPSSWWCSLAREIYYQPPDYVPPPIVFTDPATVIAVATAVREPVVDGFGQLGLRSGTSLAGAEALLRRLPTAGRRVGMSDVVVQPGNGLGLRSSLPFEVSRAVSLGSVVRSGTGPVWVASVAAGLALMGAAGIFWAQKRRKQLSLFDGQGVGSVAVGCKAVLELGGPSALGAAIGWGVARLAIAGLGPAARPETSSQARAGLYATAILVAGLALMGGVVAVAVRSRPTSRARTGPLRSLRWFPAEALLLVGAVLVVVNSTVSQADSGSPTKVVSVSAAAVLFPLLLLSGLVVLIGRVVGPLLRLARRGRYASAPWLWLASRRLADRSGLAVLLVAMGMVPVGLLGYGAGVSASSGATLRAKGSVFVGSDVRIQLPLPAPVPTGLQGRATEVVRLAEAQTSGSAVDVIGVDPATFAAGAYWDPGLTPGYSLARLLRLLEGSGAVPPAIVVGLAPVGPISAGPTGDPFRFRVAATVPAFPGSNGTLVVVDRTRLAAFGSAVSYEIWAKGSSATVLASLARSGVLTGVVVSRVGVLDATGFRATAWTVDYLSTGAWVFAAMSIAGLALYIDARQRNRGSAYVLARRMGLRRRTHLLALGVELGTPALAGIAAGGLVAVLATRAIAAHLDPYRDLPPAALVRVPDLPLAVGAALIAGSVAVCCLVAQRSSDQARPAEVLRDAG